MDWIADLYRRQQAWAAAEVAYWNADPNFAIARIAIVATAVAIVLILALAFWRDLDRAGPTRRTLLIGLLVVTIIGWLVGVLFLAAALLIRFAWVFQAALEMPALVFGGALTVALTLYWLRGRALFIYALLELLVGSLAMMVAALALESALAARLLSLASGIYILVRGLDNAAKGLPESWRTRRDAWLEKRRKPPVEPKPIIVIRSGPRNTRSGQSTASPP